MEKNHKFPVATHSYFKVQNLDEEYAKFIESDNYQPIFEYPKYFNVRQLTAAQKSAKRNSAEYLSLQCAIVGARLQNDDGQYRKFRKINARIFGAPNKKYAFQLMSKMLKKSTAETMQLRNEIIGILGKFKNVDKPLGPSQSTFERYREYFRKYRGSNPAVSVDVADNINYYLDLSGLSAAGWSLQLIDGNSHCSVCRKAKKIKMGRDFTTRSRLAARRIALHEVYGHALRGRQTLSAESEGFAILLEQLVIKKFKLRRSYRYLAACLGWGIFGRPMTFREVHDVLWRLMVISSKHEVSAAKRYAFNECARVFRGGRPDLAGTVYLKDSIYLPANLEMWKILEKKGLGYREFVDIIEGRRAILK